MNTNDLIQSLVEDLRPVPRHAIGRRIAAGMVAGGLVTFLVVALGMGFRPDLWIAMHGWAFWMKWGYTISLGGCAVAATAKLARPDTQSLRWLWIIAAPVLVLAIIGASELAHTPSSQWLSMWLGASWKVCSRSVFLLSLPIFVGLLWAFRKLAPTRLRVAGATAGLTAGAWAATLYCLHCPEVSAIFVLTWYSLGIGLVAAIGALLGPRFLRW